MENWEDNLNVVMFNLSNPCVGPVVVVVTDSCPCAPLRYTCLAVAGTRDLSYMRWCTRSACGTSRAGRTATCSWSSFQKTLTRVRTAAGSLLICCVGRSAEKAALFRLTSLTFKWLELPFIWASHNWGKKLASEAGSVRLESMVDTSFKFVIFC